MAANKAVFLELNEFMHAKQYTVAAGTSISKGDLLKLSADNTAAAADGDGDPTAGIAAADKDGSDSSTKLGVYTPGQGNKFDLTVAASSVTLGHKVVISGANLIRDAVQADLLTGAVIGEAQEAGDPGEVIVVLS